jgi:hypothetical protein
VDINSTSFFWQDVSSAAVWFTVSTLAVVAAWRWVVALFPGDAPFAKIVHVLVLCWGSLCVTTVALGLGQGVSGPALLTAVTVLALLALAGHRLFAPQPAHALVSAGEGNDGFWLVPWALVAAWWAGHVIVNGLLRFPSDGDSLEYHLPMIDLWLQGGGLYIPDGSRRCANPGNNEVLGLWLVAPYSGNFFIHLNNFLPAVLLACAAVEVARALGLSRRWSHLFGLMAVSQFVILRQLVNAQNDVGSAACLFACVFYLFRHHRDGRFADLLLGAVSLGLLAGVKYYSVGYAALVFFVWVLLSLGKDWRQLGKTIALLTCGSLAVGGYWYIRNITVSGSPFYPRDFFKSPDLLTQIYPEVGKTSFLGNRSPDLLPLYVSAIWDLIGPCHLAAFLFAPLALCWLLGAGSYHVLRGSLAEVGRTRLALGALLAGTALLLGITPMAVENDPGTLNQLRMQYCPMRYSLSFLTMAGLAFFVVAGDLIRWRPRGVPAAAPSRCKQWVLGCAAAGLALAIAFQYVLAVARFARRFSERGAWGKFADTPLVAVLIISANLLILIGIIVLLVRLFPRAVSWLRWGGAGACLLLWVCVTDALAQRWHQDFAHSYDSRVGRGVTTMVRQPPGTRVCALTAAYYPFFGPERQFHVCKPYYVYSSDWLMAYLREKQIDYVSANFGYNILVAEVAKMNQHFEDCVHQYPEVFKLVYQKNAFRVFRIQWE